MSSTPTILEVMDSFASEFPGDSWLPHRSFLAALFGLPMDEPMLAIYREMTGRTTPPTSPSKVATLLCGRRSGKSKIAALIAVYLALFMAWPTLSRGERGRVMIIAVDKKQARGILDFIDGLFMAAPDLQQYIERQTTETIELTNGITIECRALSFRSTRGSTVVALLADEVCYWRSDESAVPDIEVIRAIRPSMLTVPNSMMLALSSPYIRRGWAYQQWRDNYGIDGRPLVWQASTARMNTSIALEDLDALRAEDPTAAINELDAQWRADVTLPFDPELVEKLTRSEPLEIPYIAGTRYHAFVDPSGGAGDEFTLSVAHADKAGRVIVDLVRAVSSPFAPKAAVANLSAVVKAYHLRQVTGDRYAAEWPVDEFRSNGIEYKTSELTKSELFNEAVAIFNQHAIELPPDKVATTQIGRTERTATTTGDKYDHPKGQRDDRANAIIGAAYLVALSGRKGIDLTGVGESMLNTMVRNPGSVIAAFGPSSGSSLRSWSKG